MNDNTKIVKIKKNEAGEITDVMLEDGIVLPLNHAIMIAKDGLIDCTTVSRGKNGGEFLKVDPECSYPDILSKLPKFKD